MENGAGNGWELQMEFCCRMHLFRMCVCVCVFAPHGSGWGTTLQYCCYFSGVPQTSLLTTFATGNRAGPDFVLSPHKHMGVRIE